MQEFSKEQIEQEYLKGKTLRYSESKHKDIRNFIENKIKLNISHKEKVFCYINNTMPECKTCGKFTKFVNFKIGYKDFCSISCQVKFKKEIQENTRKENIEKKVKNLTIEELILKLYKNEIKIQKWRDIEKLKQFKDFYSLEQLYKHVILKENQICSYCGKILFLNKKTKNVRNCNCLTNKEKIILDFLSKSEQYKSTNILNFIINNKIFSNYKIKNEIFEKIKTYFFIQYEKFNWVFSFSENVYCIKHNILINPESEFINFSLGYKKKSIIINYNDNFFNIMDQFKTKYSLKGLKNSNEVKEFCSEYPGRTVSETIFMKQFNYSEIPICKKCKNSKCKFISHKKYYSLLCDDCLKNSGFSSQEKEIVQFIKSFYNNLIIENDRSNIHKEIDIFIPKLNLGIEFNGIYWHSCFYKEQNYHLLKTEECEKKEFIFYKFILMLGKINKI